MSATSTCLKGQVNSRHIFWALLCLVFAWVSGIVVGHSLISAMYNGTSLEVLNGLLTNKQQQPLTHYLAMANRIVTTVCFLGGIVGLLFFTRCWRSAPLFLLILVTADVVLAVMSERYGSVFDLRKDWSFPEIFQYMKEAGITALLVTLFLKKKEMLFVALSGLFGFFLLDDSLKYHERVGALIAGFPGVSFLADALTVRSTDVGELLSLVVPVAVFGSALLWGYFRGTAETRKVGRLFVVMIAILAFFGAFVDLLDQVALFENYRRQIGFVEDFGEMLMMSGILAFAMSLVWQDMKGTVHIDREVPGTIASDVNGAKGISCNR